MEKTYDADGAMERIDPARLTIGCVLRMPSRGETPPFSDAVVTGIYTRSWKDPTKRTKFHDNLLLALQAVTKEEYVFVKLSRPYLYAHNIGGALPNWLTGVETYEAMGHTIIDTHKVVVTSAGKYVSYIAWKDPTK